MIDCVIYSRFENIGHADPSTQLHQTHTGESVSAFASIKFIGTGWKSDIAY